MTSSVASDPPSCPMCQQNAAVVPIVYGLINLDKSGKEAARRGNFVMGGCCPQSETWYCKRCEHKFVDPQPAKPASPTASEAENDIGRINAESRDGMPVRFMKKTFFQSGITVMLTKAVTRKGYFVIVDYPDGHRAVVEADSRARAKRIARVYGLGDNTLVM